MENGNITCKLQAGSKYYFFKGVGNLCDIDISLACKKYESYFELMLIHSNLDERDEH